MNEVNTSWTHATTNVSKAMIGLVSCLEAGKNAWIEVRKNGDQKYPIMRVNPLLDDPFNWTMNYGTIRNEKELEKHQFINETEKDLTYNWTSVFSTKDAIEEYKKNRTVTKELIFDGGICCPVRIEDANAYRRDVVHDNCDYRYWMTFWKPKDGIPTYVVDDNVDDVFVVCYSDSPVNKKEAAKYAALFFKGYADCQID